MLANDGKKRETTTAVDAVAFARLVIVFALAISGCGTLRGVPNVENSIVEHYRNVAENIAFPEPSQESVVAERVSMGNSRPLTDPTEDELRQISLSEAVRIAVENNKILRQNAQFMAPQNPLMQNPDGVASVFDPNIQNSGVLFGNRGTEAALSDFDPKLSSSFTTGRDATGQNSTLQQGNVLTNDNGRTKFQVDQQLLTGGIFSLTHDWTYSDSNAPNSLFGTTYVGQLGVQFEQPLWSGFGREVTAIAGPSAQQARGFSYVNQGVVIARINNHIAEIDFQENLQNLLREVGEVYWELYEAFCDFEIEKTSLSIAKDIWEAKKQAELIGESEEAQAEDAFHEATARRDQSLSHVLQLESRFRRLLSLPIEDGQLLYPSDAPIEREIRPVRAECLFEALTNRLELKRQKTNIRSLELQLTAAKNLANPTLNLVAGYGLNGFGNHLLSGSPNDGITQEGFGNAYDSLLRGKQTSWNLGLQYSMPLWLRTARVQIQQLEFRIVKARLSLAAQEDEIARELQSVMLTMQNAYSLMQTNQRRLTAAKRRYEAAKREHEDAGRIGIDAVLKAELSMSQAESAFFRSLGEYNKAIRNLDYRMGRLPSADGIDVIDSEGLPLHTRTGPPIELGRPNPPVPSQRPTEKTRPTETMIDPPQETRIFKEASPWTESQVPPNSASRRVWRQYDVPPTTIGNPGR